MGLVFTSLSRGGIKCFTKCDDIAGAGITKLRLYSSLVIKCWDGTKFYDLRATVLQLGLTVLFCHEREREREREREERVNKFDI